MLLEPYVDGDLVREDASLAAAVREHFATCADCRLQHDHAASLPYRLKALSVPVPRDSLLQDVLRSVVPGRTVQRRAWALLAPEAVLVGFILWYLSGLDGLASIVSGMFGDLISLGAGSVPSVPPVDAVLLVALITLTAVAAYHLSVLIRLAPTAMAPRRTARE